LYNKNKSVSFSFLYFCLFGCKFEVWRKKTHLIFFQVGFFFIIINFICSYFLFFIWFQHLCKFVFFLNYFTVFPFPCFIFFHSFFFNFCVFTFYFVYVCFMFLFFLFLFCLSSFFLFYAFIYFVYIFLFKNILVFLICFIIKIIFKNFCIFVWLDAGPPVFPKDFFNRTGTKSPYFKEKKVKFARFRP